MRRLSLLCGVVAPIPLTVSWIAGGLVQEGYSVRREDVSALAAETADHPWIVILGLVLSGLLTAAFAAGLWSLLPRARAATTLVGFVGVGTVALGALRNDCSSMTEACRARVEAGEVSWHHLAHDALSIPVIGAAVLAPAVFALRGSVGAWSRAGSLATAATLAVLFSLGGAEAVPGWEGALQRGGISVAFLWLEALALYVQRMRLAGFEPAALRSGGARSIP